MQNEPQQPQDLRLLLRNLPAWNFTGGHVASRLVAHGPGAFPVACVGGGDSTAAVVVVAATRHGLGRAVHFGHEFYLLSEPGNGWDRMQVNCLRWCLGATGGVNDDDDGDDDGIGKVGDVIFGTDEHLPKEHVFHRLRPRYLPRSSLSIETCQVYLTRSYSGDDADRIVDFVAKGGGLLSGGHAWYWSYSNSGKCALREYPGNQWLSKLGIGVTSVTADVVSQASPEPPAKLPPPPPGLIALLASDEVADEAAAAASLQFAGQQVFVEATVDVAEFEPAWRALRAAAAARGTGGAWISRAGVDLSMWLVPALVQECTDQTPAGTLLHRSPEAAKFPGDVAAASDGGTADGPAVIRATVDASYAGLDSNYMYAAAGAPVWRGTGAYAPPGCLIVLEVPESMAGKGLDLLIGCHTDVVPAGKSRPPVVHCVFPIAGRLTRGCNPYGGIVYVRIPPGSSLGQHEVSVTGAVTYPLFSLGETEPTQWLRQLRQTRAPMMELRVPGQLVISVPTSAAPLLQDDPERVARLWQRAMSAINKFHCVSGDPKLSGKRDRPREERIVLDKEISAGSMHAGYPVMGYLDYDQCLLSYDKIISLGSWGPVHELGHNHQWSLREFPGTGEASNNVTNVYVHEKVFQVSRGKIPAITEDARRQRILEYTASPERQFHGIWGVWVALETFLQLQESFGWDPFKAVNLKYQQLGQKTPGSDQDRIDTYVRLFSQQVGKNLLPFFRAWGFPVSQAVEQALDGLPLWNDHPMVDK